MESTPSSRPFLIRTGGVDDHGPFLFILIKGTGPKDLLSVNGLGSSGKGADLMRWPANGFPKGVPDSDADS